MWWGLHWANFMRFLRRGSSRRVSTASVKLILRNDCNYRLVFRKAQKFWEEQLNLKFSHRNCAREKYVKIWTNLIKNRYIRNEKKSRITQHNSGGKCRILVTKYELKIKKGFAILKEKQRKRRFFYSRKNIKRRANLQLDASIRSKYTKMQLKKA